MFVGGKLMSFSGVLLSVFEAILVGFTLWALFHEDFFVCLEDKIIARLRRRGFKVIKGSKSAERIYFENN